MKGGAAHISPDGKHQRLKSLKASQQPTVLHFVYDVECCISFLISSSCYHYLSS